MNHVDNRLTHKYIRSSIGAYRVVSPLRKGEEYIDQSAYTVHQFFVQIARDSGLPPPPLRARAQIYTNYSLIAENNPCIRNLFQLPNSACRLYNS